MFYLCRVFYIEGIYWDGVDEQITMHVPYVECTYVPGFGDSGGPEIDIANGIGIVKAVHGAKTVRLLVLSSLDGVGGRMENIKKLAHTLSVFMPTLQQKIDSFSYGFTKFPKTDKALRDLHGRLVSTLKHLDVSEKGDSAFTSLLEDMIDKTDPDDLVARIIDPVNDKPGPYIKKLFSVVPISDPKATFHHFVSKV